LAPPPFEDHLATQSGDCLCGGLGLRSPPVGPRRGYFPRDLVHPNV